MFDILAGLRRMDRYCNMNMNKQMERATATKNSHRRKSPAFLPLFHPQPLDHCTVLSFTHYIFSPPPLKKFEATVVAGQRV